ncbi:MAG TPA: L-seryl-tRNA(Sec) selenium transferase [Planctomycetota bacterium]|nr:L-seryl-tRNA(Sec) selenium transferase [Planctomycetota bacterium]OQC20953.1 MAG: L-seryl-tRNA(Sec) selenium transferase [Planctomycetes bacterium ADurb.Bin069]NMD34995.1 L-seryl-tRNA(Sec) selenium transferase [Planctomycetota bacterium]HNR98449.1 L-seryl-tRNA(Sec) selenium transferase [Planctomycetota bacterium]HNU25131.1 L-seryl-tRNA(Sec) selenium transferase [Planctomycetota bacterium]
MNTRNDARRRLPSMSALLANPRIEALIAAHTRPLVARLAQKVLAEFRGRLAAEDSAVGAEDVIAAVEAGAEEVFGERLRRVVNATGIILHTGLGRAVLPDASAAALASLNRCCNMQIDLGTGLRGKRNFMTEHILCELTGAEAAMVVNNNAAATYLILVALCKGKEVIVSRGQLIEIGGSFRLPECIHQSGAIAVEVGTTNRTHLRDYAQALSPATGAILRVNTSNYRIEGFAKEVSIGEIATLKKDRDVLVIDDLGCGAIVDLTAYGLPKEPTAQDSLAAGADLVCFSGDKLIGGAQAGIILGRRRHIAAIKKHPMTRMFRVCKLTDLALEHALRLFLHPETLAAAHPTLRMMTLPPAVLEERARALKESLAGRVAALKLAVKAGESETGGGSLPGARFPTYVLAVRSDRCGADGLSRLLRRSEPPIVGRIAGDDVLIDMRTLLEGEAEIVAEALARIDARLAKSSP